jgi:cytidine deaminase
MSAVEDLFPLAQQAQARAYAPYSRFPVGAALRTETGALFAGCNVENAAYPLGICAETAAIAAMVAAGERRIAEILVLGPGPEKLSPCGACRQRIAEFLCDGGLVHLAAPEGDVVSLTMGELLPHAFGPDALKRG